MAGGRPTDYDQSVLDIAEDYIKNHKDTYGDIIPSVAGLACAIGVAKSTVYLWRDLHPEFSDSLNRLLTDQERQSVNGGISGLFNPTITKLVLANHGYSDSATVTQTTTHKVDESLAEKLTGGSKR